MWPRAATRQEISNPQVAGSNPAGDAKTPYRYFYITTLAPLIFERCMHGRCEPTRARCMGGDRHAAGAAIAIGYDKKSECVKSLTSGLRTICQSNHQLITLERVTRCARAFFSSQ